MIGSRRTVAHPNFDEIFFWYIDASREWGHGFTVYQDDSSFKEKGHLKQWPIVFPLRKLKAGEKNC